MGSIAYGVIAGIATYLIINGPAWALRKISGGRIAPPNYDLAERWVVPPGGIVPGWVRALTGRPPVHEEVRMERREVESPSLEEQMHQKSFASTADDVKR